MSACRPCGGHVRVGDNEKARCEMNPDAFQLDPEEDANKACPS